MVGNGIGDASATALDTAPCVSKSPKHDSPSCGQEVNW
jgi:hypothetical protein